MPTLLICFLAGLGCSVLLVPIIKRVAHRIGCVATPKEDRWHRRTTPLLGGVAILLGSVPIGLALNPGADVLILMACGLVMFAVGLVDDIIVIRPATKLVAEIAVASILLFADVRLHWADSMVLDALLTIVWIVGLTNAFNLLDNMDGLCAGIALIAIMFLVLDGHLDGEHTALAGYMVALGGATLGFLLFNFSPASIFMGDSGSLFLGFTVSALTLNPSQHYGGMGLLPVLAGPTMLLLVPIFDTALVTAARVLAGRRPSVGGRDHSSHRLVAVGLSERMAVIVLWALAVLSGLLATGLEHVREGWLAAGAASFALAMIIFAVYLARVRVYEGDPTILLRRANLTPLVTEFMYKRRAAEVLLDVCLVTIAYYGAYNLRFEGVRYLQNYPYFIESFPVVLGTQMTALYLVGGYRGVWRQFSLIDAVVFAKGVLAGAIGAQLALLYLYRFEHYSRSIFIIYAALAFLLLVMSRASFRLVGEFIQRRTAVGRRCVIYGAGEAAILAVRELRADPDGVRVLGFIDDDPLKQKLRLAGYAVIGPYATLGDIIRTGRADAVVISSRHIDLSRQRELERLCDLYGVQLMRLHVDLQTLVAAS